MLITVFHVFGQLELADELTPDMSNALTWYPFDGRLFCANAAAACFSTLIVPIFYFARRHGLRRKYSLEFCVFGDLAKIEPSLSIDQRRTEEPAQDPSRPSYPNGVRDEPDWFAILGLAPSATIEEIRMSLHEFNQTKSSGPGAWHVAGIQRAR